jgi:hypothetical protein
MSSWQVMRDLYDELEVPIALVRFAREVVFNVIDEAPISSDAKNELTNKLRTVLDKHLAGHEFKLANYLFDLMEILPTADPYQHVDEK